MQQKIFIIVTYTLAFFLFYHYFFSSERAQKVAQTGVVLSIQDATIVIPNAPKVDITNHSATGFTLSPCTDMILTIDSVPIQGIADIAPKFCTPISIGPRETHHISFDPLSKLFQAKPGNYIITAKTPVGDRVVHFELSPPGTFRSSMTTLFYNPIYNFFVGILTWLPGHPLGWAIIILTVIIRLILLVPQQHMLESQKKMNMIQPKIKELQKKYKDDQATLGMEMLNLYKKEGVSPLGSCLPLLIQMPILIGLYWVVSGITEEGNIYHLYPFFSGFNPSLINTHFLGINLLSTGGVVAGIVAGILGVLQYIQARLSFSYNPPPTSAKKETPPPENKSEEMPEIALDPDMMKNMMLYVFPLTIAVSAFFVPLGVGLYWFIVTIFVIAQQWYANQKSKK